MTTSSPVHGRLRSSVVDAEITRSSNGEECRREKCSGTEVGQKRIRDASPGSLVSSRKERKSKLESCNRNGEKKEVSNRPRRAAAGTDFKEKHIFLSEKNAKIEVKKENVVDDEEVAVVLTSEPGEEPPPQRRLLEFFVHDESGRPQPIESIDFQPLYLTALVFPRLGGLDKSKGYRCESFGPLETWSIVGYENASPTVVLTTDIAEYDCTKPAGAYRSCFNVLYEKARLCVEVFRSLSKPDGGDPLLSLNDMTARVSRSFGKQGVAGQFFSRDFLLTNGKFVAAQLTALDENATDNQQLFSGLPALAALHQESERRGPMNHSACQPIASNGSIKIREGDCKSSAGGSVAEAKSGVITDDEKLARMLQEEDLRARDRQSRRVPPISKGKVYIKVNEAEIADDYPLPAFYKAEVVEMDEYILFDDESSTLDADCLPQRMLHDWALYNSDSRLMPLELLPMLPGAETDMEIFGSGVMTEDDGTGFCLDDDDNSLLAPREMSSLAHGAQQGFRIYLSAVKEWKIEFGASMLFISLRTDGAWYRLGKPSLQYAAWYKPVLKTARLAIKVITMLKDELRVSRLSYSDVIKKLSDQGKDDPTFISSKPAVVGRYVLVHGQIFLQQFSEYPDETIRRSAFITGLVGKMEQLSHTKLVLKKKVLVSKGKNLNPRANLKPDLSKLKAMRATTTQLINRIWSGYYADTPECGTVVENGAKEVEVVEEEAQESEDEVEDVAGEEDFESPLKNSMKRKPKKAAKSTPGKVRWIGKSVGVTVSKEPAYGKVLFNGNEIAVGGSVLINVLDEQGEDSDILPAILLVEYFFESKDGPMLHGRVLQRGIETVLGNAANEWEVFLTDICEDMEVDRIKGSVVVEMRNRPWGHEYRKGNFAQDEAYRIQAEEHEKKGLPKEYFCRSLYSSERGGFFSIPKGGAGQGNGTCQACTMRQAKKDKMETKILPENKGFRYQGVEYHVNDYLYLDPDTFKTEGTEERLYKAGRNKGLRAFAICQLLSVQWMKNKSSNSASLHVRRFFRPEDVDVLKSCKADLHEVYYSEVTLTIDLMSVRGRCEVRRQVEVLDASAKFAINHVFFCNCIHDPKKGTVKQLPANIKLTTSNFLEATKGKSQYIEVAAKAKGKGKVIEDEVAAVGDLEGSSSGPLATLDIFAGCGGLSEGLHQSGVSCTKWAIEYDHAAAEAFKLNHPRAEVFCENCNVMLRSIMERGGDLDDCLSTTEADELSQKMDEEKKSKLPKPGEVDFIDGGPPCQGFSGMNRFNQRAWSKVQCEMILSFLSYADYFRPRFFLLENVRNFVSFNKGQTFRLSLASLLDMGYQVRFGVLQAGNYGVSQSRKRAFIWAAAPDELLPEWPEPMHVFASSQLKISLPGGIQYAAAADAAQGAPLRSITVRDTIGDLPPVLNGAEKGEIEYVNSPQSWFQKEIRGHEMTLYDHICKEMNELNLLRCQRIPREPGADWRSLPDEKVKLSTGQLVDLIPWCLPNTADRHNQWKGLFGRLDWDGNFPTSVTDPQPMGKVGMCFHPEQDRIVTVRECARSQGFPDSYKFFGNLSSKHRQIGNAVPPPLALALGFTLKEAINARTTKFSQA